MHDDDFAQRLRHNRLTRRNVLWLFGAGALASSLSGCARSPVVGERIPVGTSAEQERQADRQVAPHRFSQDMGPVQDEAVNHYVAGLGDRMDDLTQRPSMTYSYRVLNASCLNASPQRERLMDNTASLRRLKPAIDACMNGEVAMARKQLPQAQGEFARALAAAPRDCSSNLLTARCLAAQGKQKDALRCAEAARSIYPQEAQAHKLAGVLQLAENYTRFPRSGGQGKPAEYSMNRLESRGYTR
jgi:predicted Zn-dependent protease